VRAKWQRRLSKVAIMGVAVMISQPLFGAARVASDRVLSLSLLPAFRGGPHAQDLMTAYRDALRHDPVFQEEMAVYLAARQLTTQARSALLPQIILDLTRTRASERRTSRLGGPRYYNSDRLGLNLSQTLFNISQFKALSEAKASVRAAMLLLLAQSQNLMRRVTEAYLTVLRDRAILGYTREQMLFLKRELKGLLQRYHLRYTTITDLNQTRATYRLVRAQYVTASLNLYNSVQALYQITGVTYHNIAPLREGFAMPHPVPADLSRWVEAARHNNLTLKSAQESVVAVHQSVGRAAGGFFPVVNAIASYNNFNGIRDGGLFPGDTQQENTSIAEYGVSMNWPVFQGGLTVAQVRRAKADLCAAKARVSQAYLASIADSQRFYVGVVDGMTRVTRDRFALIANRSALKNAQEGFIAGVQTIFDVLQAQSRLFNTQTSYANDLYEYLIQTVRLREVVGTLSPTALSALNSMLQTQQKKPYRGSRWPLKDKEKVQHPEHTHWCRTCVWSPKGAVHGRYREWHGVNGRKS
jgi:outer membrane protein